MRERIQFAYPIAKPGWSQRLYPVAEFLTTLFCIAVLIAIFIVASLRG